MPACLGFFISFHHHLQERLSNQAIQISVDGEFLRQMYCYLCVCAIIYFYEIFMGLEIIKRPFLQVHSLDFSGSCVSSSQLSVNGSGYEDESIFIFDYISIFHLVSSCFSHHISWSLVYRLCFTCGGKETRDLDHSSKLCGKFGR